MGKEKELTGKKKYGAVAAFITEHSKEDVVSEDGKTKRFKMTQAGYEEFLKGRGLNIDTIKQVAEANIEFNNGCVNFLSTQLVDDAKLNQVSINTRTPQGVVSARMTRSVEARLPADGSTFTKYGQVSLTIKMKSRLDPELLDECSKELENHSK